jgi:hypothetical protein
MILKKQQHWGTDLCYPDCFNNRLKRVMFNLAEIRPSDTFYDLGCGDASILIAAVRKFSVKRAIGFEDNNRRYLKARKNVDAENLSYRITIQKRDMYHADLNEADVIFAMLPEEEYDFEQLYKTGIRRGTRLIKHDLPLIGYIPDKIDYPFYRMTFPLKKAMHEDHWASKVLVKNNAKIEDVWHELYYYESEKHYTLWDIRRFKKILIKRLKR